MNKKNYSNEFVVKLNWVGIFETITACVGILLSFGLMFFLIKEIEKTNEDGINVAIVMCIPILMIIFCVWLMIPMIFNKIEVKGDVLVIRRPFGKKNTVRVDDIISYSNNESFQKGHRYFHSLIVYGEDKSIEVRNDIYKNYDLLMYYLSKNVKHKK